MVTKPPTPEKAGYQLYLLHAALGGALDRWGYVEAAFSAIFCAAVNRENQVVASAAFSAVRSLETQFKMTDAAVSQAFASDEKLLTAWRAILKVANKLRENRNQLAHGKTIFVANTPKGLGDVRFLPFFNPHTHKDRREFEHYSVEDVDAMTEKFLALQKDLQAFGKDIGAVERLKKQNWHIPKGQSK